VTLGEGYWIKFPATSGVSITGMQAGRDTIDIAAGWNLIGAVSGSLDTGAVLQMPPGLVISPYYAYAAGYAASDSLRPGSGYWVKAASAGRLVLAPLAPRPPAARRAAAPAREAVKRGSVH